MNAVATARRRATETKQAFKTTEFAAYVVVLIGILIAGGVTSGSVDANGNGHPDPFGAHQVWLYATILTIGYMVARGLAKAGSADPYTESHTGGGIGDRVGAAAAALRGETEPGGPGAVGLGAGAGAGEGYVGRP